MKDFYIAKEEETRARCVSLERKLVGACSLLREARGIIEELEGTANVSARVGDLIRKINGFLSINRGAR